jgi:retron-type reverse transcriptase
MKRHGNLWEKITDIENIKLAHKNARKGKTKYKAVQEIDEDIDRYANEIHQMLIAKTFTTSEYKMFIKKDRGKVREIYKLPYFPDRIIQHAIMQVVEPIWKRTLIADTYQSIKGRGVHKVLPKVVKAVQQDGVKYCLKMDIEKFYPSIAQDIMKQIVRRKIKCKDTLWLLDDIIDSSDKGLPIGNYISQYLGNLYLSKLDHTMKEDLQVKYYYRYCDDIVVLSNDKGVLHVLCKYAEDVLKELQVRLKKDYRVHPVEVGVDLLGYVVSKAKVQVRSNVKRSMLTRYSAKSAPSYDGVLCHCDGYGLKIRLKECVK